MANINRILIEGRVPYNIVEKLSPEGCRIFARFSSPCGGFHISYGKESYEPNVETGGQLSYYDFKIDGEDAAWESYLVKMCKELKSAGAEIIKADVADMEFEAMPSTHSILSEI